MLNNAIMKGKDALSAKLAECFVTIEGRRYNFMQAINLEAKTGTGSATFHYNTPIFRQLLKRYKDTGEDVYFDIQIANEDSTSAAGRQTIILKDCNLDGGILAKFDADGEYLDEDMDFTFEDWSMPEEFAILEGMM